MAVWMEEQEIGLTHSTSEISARHSSGDIKREVEYVTLEHKVKV